jgi:hypothetical protein
MKLGTSNIVSVWFGVVMVTLLVSGAIAFIFTDFMSDTLNGNRRIFFVVLLLSYSAYRSIRIYQVIKRSKLEE